MKMPNWCNNRLTIAHKDADVIDNLMAQIRAGDGNLFQFIKPMPDNIFRGALGDDERKECESKGIPNWYDWSVSNWGTKWDACNMSWSQLDDHTLEFDFDSAWSPPFGVYEALAEQEFEVEAYYVEYGMMYAGEWHCDADGQVTDEYSDDISEYVPEGVDEVFDVTEQLAEWAEEEKEYA
jgi:hypothetical protein